MHILFKMQITKVNMHCLRVISGFMLLLTASAIPEIPTKGKHSRNQDLQQTTVEDADMPRFAENIANVTVSVGRDALLACVVENLKGYKVAWVRVDTQTILSIHHNVISQNNRISLTYNDHRSWYLHIKEVEESDRGWYMCQVNTDPMRSHKGYLQVVVPPVIVEGMTSNDLVVREGLNVTLMCKARGYPEPYVMWRREDGEEMLIGGEHVNVVDGELLHITKVSRLHMAAYLCVASNGVPPSISKRVHLRVQFPPMLSIPNQLEGAYMGQDVVLECHTEAYPASINYWTTERGDMIISDTSRAGDKYETTSTVNGYTKYMKLKIRSVGPSDFGTYRCVAKNSLGETDGNIKLDEMPAPTTSLTFDGSLNRSNGENFPTSMFNSNNFGRGKNVGNGGMDGNSIDDNNQASIRNPPGAFHNAASTLAQNNLLVKIIQQIKKKSVGIREHLLTFWFNTTSTTLSHIEVLIRNIHKIPKILLLPFTNEYFDVSSQMKILIEVSAHIEIWCWHLCKTILSYLYLTIDDKILAHTTNTNATITTTTTTTTPIMQTYSHVNDNCYYLKGRHSNNKQHFELFVDTNNLNNNNNNNNNIIISKRYKYNMKSRQTDYNGHNESIVTEVVVFVVTTDYNDDDDVDVDDDFDCDLNKSNRKNSRNRQRIVNANNKNQSSKQNKNNLTSTSLCVDDDFGVGYKIPNCRMLPTPLATCLLLLCNLLLSSSFLTLCLLLLLLSLLLLCFSFPQTLHLVVSTTTTTTTTWWTTHFISILSVKRVFSIRTHNVKKKTKYGCQMKINRGLLFNSDHHLNAITTNKQQQQLQQQQQWQHIQNQIESFISKLTTTECANILFSKIDNFKVSLR